MSNPTNENSDLKCEMRDLTPVELELERALSALRPASIELNLPAGLFAAGRAAGAAAERRSACRSILAWRAAAALLAVTTAVSLTANVRLMSGSIPIATIPATNLSPSVTPDVATSHDNRDRPGPREATGIVRAGDDLLALRTIALADGIDALPSSTFGSASPPVRVGDSARRQ